MFESLKGYLARGGPSWVVHECRRCGASVGADTSRCPDCESTTIARYESS